MPKMKTTKRWIISELADYRWFPQWLRTYCTEYLAILFKVGGVYRGAEELLAKAIRKTESTTIVDLCSGSSGPLPGIIERLERRGLSVHAILTDLFPPSRRFESDVVRYLPESIDARMIPAGLRGFRTMFTGFHHFTDEDADLLIANAVKANEGIGIFEVTERTWWSLLIILGTPIIRLTPHAAHSTVVGIPLGLHLRDTYRPSNSGL